MSSVQQPEFVIDSVVWYDIPATQSSGNFPWWPAKVVSVTDDGNFDLLTFGDNLEYVAVKVEKLKVFGCEDVKTLVEKGKKKLKKWKSWLSIYLKAIEEAVQFIWLTDPDFSLGFDPFADNSNQSITTPTNMDSSIFTPTTHSKESSERKALIHPLSSSTSQESGVVEDILTQVNEVDAKKMRKRSANGEKPPKSKRRKTTSGGRKQSKKMKNGELEEDEVAKKLDFLNSNAFNKTPDKRRESSRRVQSTSVPLVPSDSGRAGSPGHTSHAKGMEPQSLQNEHPSEESQVTLSPEKLPTTPRDPPTTSRDPPTTSRDPPTTSRDPPTTSRDPPTTSRDPPTTSRDPPTTPRDPPTTPRDPPTTSRDPPTTSQGENSLRDFDGDSDIMSSPPSSSEDEEDLPAINMKVNESISMSQLKPSDVLWVKHRTHPYWPAMVTKLTPKSKARSARAHVIFFGYDLEDGNKLPIRNKKNLAPFGTERATDFVEKGRTSHLCEEFQTAVSEAKNLISLRADGGIKGNPNEQLQQIAQMRPKNYKIQQSPMVVAAQKRRKQQKPAPTAETDNPAVSAFGYAYGDSLQRELAESGSDLTSESETEIEEEDSVYKFEEVKTYFGELKPVLVDIVQGRVASEYHTTFIKGTQKELRLLKMVAKYGPLKSWSQEKKQKLLGVLKPIAEEASGRKLHFTYAMDVLLPEAIIRTIMKFENMPYNDARTRL